MEEALKKKGIKIKLDGKANREEMLIKAHEIDLKIEYLNLECAKEFRKERKHFYQRLKHKQGIGQLVRAKRIILGFGDKPEYKDIDREVRDEVGLKNGE